MQKHADIFWLSLRPDIAAEGPSLAIACQLSSALQLAAIDKVPGDVSQVTWLIDWHALLNLLRSLATDASCVVLEKACLQHLVEETLDIGGESDSSLQVLIVNACQKGPSGCKWI